MYIYTEQGHEEIAHVSSFLPLVTYSFPIYSEQFQAHVSAIKGAAWIYDRNMHCTEESKEADNEYCICSWDI